MLEQPPGASVQVVHGNDAAARGEGFQEGGQCPQTGREGEAPDAPFESSECRLQDRPGGVPGTAVDVPLVLVRCGLAEGAREVDRRTHRARGRIDRLTVMNDSSAKPHGTPLVRTGRKPSRAGSKYPTGL